MFRTPTTLPSEIEVALKVALDCAFAVHRELGPGFKEKIYETAMCLEMESRGIRFESEKPIVVRYREWTIPGQRLDLLVEGKVVVEIKAVRSLKPLHRRQVVSYLKAAGLRAALVLNFNTSYLKHGIRRVVL